jgi:uncharacterized protein YkwD
MKARVGLWLLAAGVAVMAASGPATMASAGDPGNAYTLFQLTNQDRASNGLGSLGFNGGLASIATSARSGNCGGVNGRSQDMIERNYFSHQIPPCGAYVWTVFNLGAYTSAGENIGWNNYPPAQSVSQINTAFMNSPEHRANILGGYNQMGTGAWQAPGPWSGAGGPYNGVIMYTEIFINSPGGGGAPPPPPPPPPPPVRRKVTAPPSGGGAPLGGGNTAEPVVQDTTQPAPAAPSPSPTPQCPVPTEIGEADRTSPAPTLASDGGPAPCPTPNLVGTAPSPGPAVITLTGTMDAGSRVVIVSSTAGMATGDLLTVPGAGADGGDLTARITAIKGNRVTLDAAAVTSVKDARVQDQPASEVVGADREATRRGLLETVVDQVLRLFLNV